MPFLPHTLCVQTLFFCHTTASVSPRCLTNVSLLFSLFFDGRSDGSPRLYHLFGNVPYRLFFGQLLVRTPARNAAQLPLESALFGAFTGAEYTPVVARLCPNMPSYEDGSMVGAAYLRNRVTAGFARGGIRGVFRLGSAPVSRTACRTGVYRYCSVYGEWGGMR